MNTCSSMTLQPHLSLTWTFYSDGFQLRVTYALSSAKYLDIHCNLNVQCVTEPVLMLLRENISFLTAGV